ncbi:P-loop containing nucleoside triphosphate hydrolase protein [Nemania sp. FL0031]|nr:P-loop containing nucleoside triphosphate hydrolase protein [Nemania sp. FL0031]
MVKDRAPSPLWHRALEQYRLELQGTENYETIPNVGSLEELIGSFAQIQATAPGSYSGINSLNRLAPKLKFVDDFSAVLALCFGADAALTAAVWGSIRLILAHASSTVDIQRDVLDMIEELSLSLPRFQIYEQTLPLSRQFQQTLVDAYTEIICFYARTIRFLRSHPHLSLRKNEWQSCRDDLSITIKRIKRISSVIESEADIARMRKDEGRYKEILELLNEMKMNELSNNEKLRYNNIPFSSNPKFSGRRDILDTVHEALNIDSPSSSLRSLALFGMGGVGKTQIAVQYAYQSLHHFDVVLWIAADNAIAIGQSFRAIANGLGLFETDDDQTDAAAAVWKIKNWLMTTKTTCLVVFDNADDLTALKTAWPESINGSVLLTTRNLAVATTITAQYKQVDAFLDNDGSELLLKAVGLVHATASDIDHGLTISRAFGGLPLALTQIGGFIAQRRLPLHAFLPLYERNSTKIDARKPPGSDYEHTLNTVWDVAFKDLSENASRLLKLLSFFDPDGISEDILSQGSGDLDNDFSFLTDEMDLGDAAEELLQVALINRVRESADFTVHRLIQSTTMKRLKEPDTSKYFGYVVSMLCWGFPDHSKYDIGHQVSTWGRCEKCLPHVRHLVEVVKRYPKGVAHITSDQTEYSDLLIRCSWYLYEREMYIIARDMVEQAIGTIKDTKSLGYASAIDLHGLIDLDLSFAARALESFTHALEVRKAALGSEDPFIAYSLNNIALAYTEMGELKLAYAAHEEAINIRLKANSDRIGNSYSNMSSLLLRLSRPDDAEEMLARCPSLKGFTDETFINTGNPRFSGDMVLLSRIRRAQGRKSDALRLASKALAFRRKLLGNRLKTCDSQYDVASMLFDEGHTRSAIQLLQEIIGISETFVEGEGQRARALYKLSEIHTDMGLQSESDVYREEALALLANLKPELKDAPFEEATFAKLCLWMLW